MPIGNLVPQQSELPQQNLLSCFDCENWDKALLKGCELSNDFTVVVVFYPECGHCARTKVGGYT
jgi:hypothetical protein